MTVHVLKTEPPFFDDIWNHDKHFEIRYNDRGYKIWDNLVLREFIHGGYTGRELLCVVTYMLKDFDGLKEGYVAMGIDVLHTTSEYANRYGNCAITYHPGEVIKEVKNV